jgi:hypothetical protein
MVSRILAVLLVAAVLFPAPAWADGVPGTRAEEDAYAQREAASPEAVEFAGGGGLAIALAIILIAGLVVLIWYLLECRQN